jgi:hypothetical protein
MCNIIHAPKQSLVRIYPFAYILHFDFVLNFKCHIDKLHLNHILALALDGRAIWDRSPLIVKQTDSTPRSPHHNSARINRASDQYTDRCFTPRSNSALPSPRIEDELAVLSPRTDSNMSRSFNPRTDSTAFYIPTSSTSAESVMPNLSPRSVIYHPPQYFVQSPYDQPHLAPIQVPMQGYSMHQYSQPPMATAIVNMNGFILTVGEPLHTAAPSARIQVPRL